MANYVIWLDSSDAKIFELHPTEVDEKKIHRREVRHHTGFDKEKNNHKNGEKFFHELSDALTDAHEVLLVGPGETKTHFKSHLEKHSGNGIAAKIVGVETVDHPTDGQIVALAKKFFKSHLSAAPSAA